MSLRPFRTTVYLGVRSIPSNVLLGWRRTRSSEDSSTTVLYVQFSTHFKLLIPLASQKTGRITAGRISCTANFSDCLVMLKGCGAPVLSVIQSLRCRSCVCGVARLDHHYKYVCIKRILIMADVKETSTLRPV